MITNDRLKQLMEQVGMPNSISLYQALLQCDKEARISERKAAEMYKAELKAVVNHWREFGPDYGFEETLEMAARILEAA